MVESAADGEELELVDERLGARIKLIAIAIPVLLLAFVGAMTIIYGTSWTHKWSVLAGLALVASALIPSTILFGRGRPAEGRTWFALGVDLLALLIVFASPPGYALAALLVLAACMPLMGIRHRGRLIAACAASVALSGFIVAWGRAHPSAAALIAPKGGRVVAAALLWTAAASLLVGIVYAARERLGRAIVDLRAQDARRARTEVELSESLELLKQAQARQRELMIQLLTAEEEERRRIAIGLHDDPAQMLTAALLRLQTMRHQLDDHDSAEIQRVEDLLTQTLGRLRHLTFELRPESLDRQGLATAVRDLIGQYPDGPPSCHLDSSLRSEPPDDIRTIAFRIIAEAVSNAHKHARANEIRILIREDGGRLLVAVNDDGIGIDPAVTEEGIPGHLGLPGMIERATLAGGRTQVSRGPQGGTSVEAWLPLDHGD